MPQKYKVLITGSSGMLGIDLSRELSRYYDLSGFDIVSSPLSSVRRFYKCDITSGKGVLSVLRKAAPDVVIHTAAWTDVDGCQLDKRKAYKINTDGTKNVVSACGKLGAVLIYISTDFVFDGKKRRPYKEDDAPKPLSVYADSKFRGERAVEGALDRYIILRTSWLYGANGKNFVDIIMKKAMAGEDLRVVDDQIGSPTYAKDLSAAIHELLDKVFTHSVQRAAHYGIYHISNYGSVSWYDYARTILRFAGIKLKIEAISSKELNRPARRPAMSVLDNSKFFKFTGYKMRGWKTALKDYIDSKYK